MAFFQKQTHKYCDQCGRSLIPLAVPHVQRKCQECGKTVHVGGDGGLGVRIEEGETFVIPANFFRFSLDPAKATGEFSRPGILWFMKQVYAHGRANTPDDVTAMLEHYTKEADEILENSELFKHLDLNNSEDCDKAYELVKGREELGEWWAMMENVASGIVREALAEKDTPRAVWAMTILHIGRNMHVFKSFLEETVWRGYLANQVVYNVASAAAHTPVEAEAIKKLEPLFSRLEESVLHAWVNSGEPIGPRIRVTALPEETLKALAKWHLSLFESKREEERWKQEYNIKIRTARYQGIGIGIAIVAAIGGLAGGAWSIVQILKAYGKI
jgi:hypothetical protein